MMDPQAQISPNFQLPHGHVDLVLHAVLFTRPLAIHTLRSPFLSSFSSMDARQTEKPGWMTDELEQAEEWPEPGADQQTRTDSQKFSTGGTRTSLDFRSSFNFRTTRGRGNATDTITSQQVGTVLVREDVQQGPMFPKGNGILKPAMKDMFSPLALEKMFEPPIPEPSPDTQKLLPPSQHNTIPTVPSKLSQVVGSSFTEEESRGEDRDMLEIDADGNDANKLSGQSQFTFSVPVHRQPSSTVTGSSQTLENDTPHSHPLAESTPLPPLKTQSNSHLHPPGTDPRLRLFQLQYDTFTRDHLSAMVDSIAVNTTPSGEGSSKTARTGIIVSPDDGFASEHDRDHSYLHQRSTKRLKLTHPDDLAKGVGANEGAGAGITAASSQRFRYQVEQSHDVATRNRANSIFLEKADAWAAGRASRPHVNSTSILQWTAVLYPKLSSSPAVFSTGSRVKRRKPSSFIIIKLDITVRRDTTEQVLVSSNCSSSSRLYGSNSKRPHRK